MADTTDGLPPDRREVLGLLLVVAAFAHLVAGIVSAKVIASTDTGDPSITPYGGIQSGIDLELFLRALAFTTSGYQVILLAGGLVLVAFRTWDASGRAARWACGILAPLGLVVAALTTYATYLALASSQEDGPSLYGTGGSMPDRLGAAMLPLASTAVSGYVAWCAFRRLPLSSAPGAVTDEPVEVAPGQWGPPPERPPTM